MATRKKPADVTVEFFQTAPLEAASAILSVCAGIVKRRQASEPGGVSARPKATRRPAREASAATTADTAPTS